MISDPFVQFNQFASVYLSLSDLIAVVKSPRGIVAESPLMPNMTN
jgi:hypothetical protein